MKSLGLVLVVAGVLALAYQGFTYRKTEKVLDLGSIEASVTRDKTVPIPPIAGAIALVAGLAIVFASGRKRLA